MISKLLKFKNYRLRTKLIVTYVLLTVIPISLLGYIAYSQYTKSIEEQVGEYIPKLLKQANENIANQVRELREYPDLLYNSDEVVGILRKDAHQSRSALLQDEFTVNTYLTRTFINGSSQDILGVFVISKNRIFHSTKIPYSNFGLVDYSQSYGQDIQLKSNDVFVLPHQTSLRFEGDPPFVLVMKQLTDLENRTDLGTVLVAVNVTFLESVINEMSEEGKADLWMMNQDGRIIYHTDANKIRTIDREFNKYPKINGSFRSTQEDEGRLISLNYMDETGWTLAHSVLARNLTEKTDLVRNATIAIFLVFVAISTLISFLLAWNVSSPLNRLTRMMKRVEKGDFDVDLAIGTTDEIGMLANNFNSMITEIKDLIRENYQIELKQKEAELYALQSQINPHFMYNTLETIAMSVDDDEKETVVEMVTLLGRMLRFSIGNKESVVPISDELLHVKDYLTIQKIRFEEKFDFIIREEIESRNYYTPKFVLQPIVENAVKHALVYGRVTVIEIGVCLVPGTDGTEEISFKVKDNGTGIKEETLADIQQMLASDPMAKRDSHFGLSNVHARIAMNFGSGFGLNISSGHDQGTEVEIKIPVLKNSTEGGQQKLEKN
ncbi:two-component system sensor histidine kinase YesM [Planomicrobium soli]|uniref:Two-component system sensor histidine kinase YesM n=1 Tax=Planomicrobium soli TaxID=1176648 RepID=A0A2P8GQW5_9BACL|nr:sensor histidine kinase [Planomicrobium soli]PSL36361.1 two-component system sensor histidine kinase YesM [Planomicrobium soli]